MVNDRPETHFSFTRISPHFSAVSISLACASHHEQSNKQPVLRVYCILSALPVPPHVVTACIPHDDDHRARE